MPSGLFRTELAGHSAWTRLHCVLTDKRIIVDPRGQPVGSFKLNTLVNRDFLWDLLVQERALAYPSRYISNTDYPFRLDITEGECLVAVIHSGASSYDEFRLEFGEQTYQWTDVSKVRKVMELRLEDETFARVYSQGLMVNHTFVDVKRALPLEIICLLFCMYASIYRARTP